MKRILLAVSLGLILVGCGQPKPAAPAAAPAATAPQPPPSLPRTAAPAGASVSIASPADGDVVSSPVLVRFAAEGMTVVPAGDFRPDSGHHHLLINTGLPADLGQPLPMDEKHLHYGQGQTEAQLTLPPGQHTLQLVLGDGNHVPHDPPVVSAPITITVQ